MDSIKDIQTSRLCFNCKQETLDFASKCVENSRRWLVAEVGIAELYTEFRIDAVIALRLRTDGAECELTVSAIPSRGRKFVNGANAIEVGASKVVNHRNECAVLVLVAHPVDGVKKRVPSTVRLERHNKILDPEGNVQVPGFPRRGSNAALQFAGIPSKWESCAHGSWVRGLGGGKGGMVKNRPQIYDGVPDNIREVIQSGFRHPDAPDVLASAVRIWMDYQSIWAGLVEGADLFFEITNVMTRPR